MCQQKASKLEHQKLEFWPRRKNGDVTQLDPITQNWIPGSLVVIAKIPDPVLSGGQFWPVPFCLAGQDRTWFNHENRRGLQLFLVQKVKKFEILPGFAALHWHHWQRHNGQALRAWPFRCCQLCQCKAVDCGSESRLSDMASIGMTQNHWSPNRTAWSLKLRQAHRLRLQTWRLAFLVLSVVSMQGCGAEYRENMGKCCSKILNHGLSWFRQNLDELTNIIANIIQYPSHVGSSIDMMSPRYLYVLGWHRVFIPILFPFHASIDPHTPDPVARILLSSSFYILILIALAAVMTCVAPRLGR